MLTWIVLVLAYAWYLLAVAWCVPRFASARLAAALGSIGAILLWGAWRYLPDDGGLSLTLQVVVPSLIMLAAYQLSGAFVQEPDRRLERRLLDVDRRWLGRTGILERYRTAPVLVSEMFELLYLLVYVVLPAGAAALIAGGRPDHLERYWTVVFAAELACYAMLPWLQSRPPRALEPPPSDGAANPLRRLNRVVLAQGSIQANTIPSGHAAGAIAIALAVSSVLPAAGAAFLVLGIGITAATVLGRYHYLVDSVLGVAVAMVVWGLVG